MRNDRYAEPGYVLIEDVHDAARNAARRQRAEREEEIVDPWSYYAKVGRGTIRLTVVEYRILKFLAARPYQAFTRSRIADAVSTGRHCVTPTTLGRYITSLRRQLGFYSDYIQSVPHVGYRFKA